MNKLDLELTRQRIALKLAELEPLFTPEMRLTLVARHPTNRECVIVVTSDDDPAAVAAVLTRTDLKETGRARPRE